MLLRKRDVEADGRRSRVGGSSVCGFHDPRATAGRDDVVSEAAVRSQGATAFGGQARERACFPIPSRVRFRPILSNSCRSENDDGRPDAPRSQALLGLRTPTGIVPHALNRQAENPHRVQPKCRRTTSVARRSREGLPSTAAGYHSLQHPSQNLSPLLFLPPTTLSHAINKAQPKSSSCLPVAEALRSSDSPSAVRQTERTIWSVSLGGGMSPRMNVPSWRNDLFIPDRAFQATRSALV